MLSLSAVHVDQVQGFKATEESSHRADGVFTVEPELIAKLVLAGPHFRAVLLVRMLGQDNQQREAGAGQLSLLNGFQAALDQTEN